MLFTKTFVKKVVCSGILSFFCWHVTLAMVWARKPNVFSQKILLPKRCRLESAVRETLASVLSLSSITRPVKAVHYTQSFTRSVYVVCTLIKDLKDNTGLFHSYDGGENKYKALSTLIRFQTKTELFCSVFKKICVHTYRFRIVSVRPHYNAVSVLKTPLYAQCAW